MDSYFLYSNKEDKTQPFKHLFYVYYTLILYLYIVSPFRKIQIETLTYIQTYKKEQKNKRCLRMFRKHATH